MPLQKITGTENLSILIGTILQEPSSVSENQGEHFYGHFSS